MLGFSKYFPKNFVDNNWRFCAQAIASFLQKLDQNLGF
jgi:hypothetical protein